MSYSLKWTILILYFFIKLNILQVNCQKVSIRAKNPQHLKNFEENSYIVNIKEVKDEFQLTCSCQKCSNLKFSFNNFIKDLNQLVSVFFLLQVMLKFN